MDFLGILLHVGGHHSRLMFGPLGTRFTAAEEIEIAEHYLGADSQYVHELRAGDRSRVATSWDEFHSPRIRDDGCQDMRRLRDEQERSHARWAEYWEQLNAGLSAEVIETVQNGIGPGSKEPA